MTIICCQDAQKPNDQWRWTCPLLVFVIILTSHLMLVGNGPLMRTEPHRALTAHQMLAENNWIVPHLNGDVYLRKPVGHYWVLAATEWLFQTSSPWVWRLPSVLATAILGSFLSWYGGRWFGRAGALVAGFSSFALVALWSQSQSADIDALNVTVSVIGAIGIIELASQTAKPKWSWCLLTWLSLSAAWLLKGPGCLPLVGGAMLAPAVAQKKWRPLLQPLPWLCFLLSLLPVSLWAWAAWYQLQQTNTAVDFSSLQEISAQTSFSLNKLLTAVTLPLVLLAYSMPISLLFFVAVEKKTRFALDPKRQQMLHTWIACVLIGMAICVFAMLQRPRYGYVILPMLSPIAGAVAYCWTNQLYDAKTVRQLQKLLFLSGFIIAIFGFVLVGIVRVPNVQKLSFATSVMMLCVFLINLFIAHKKQQDSKQAWCVVGLLICAAILFGHVKVKERFKRSSFYVAKELGQLIKPTSIVFVGKLRRDKPELFYYANIKINKVTSTPRLDLLPPKGWLILNGPEHRSYIKSLGSMLIKQHHFQRTGLNAWAIFYDKASSPATTNPLQ